MVDMHLTDKMCQYLLREVTSGKIIIYTAQENDFGSFWKVSILLIRIKRITSSIQERRSALICIIIRNIIYQEEKLSKY